MKPSNNGKKRHYSVTMAVDDEEEKQRKDKSFEGSKEERYQIHSKN